MGATCSCCGGARSVEVVTRTSLRVPKPLKPLTIRDDSAGLSANSIAMLDALVDELCSAEVLEALLVADAIEAQRELVIDAMRDTYDLW